MIPAFNITAWSATAPWAEQRQVEQDLIISRALVDIFGDEFLASELRFRGGTALNKLHFEKPLRYSEDIDLVRTTSGGIGPILDRLRVVLSWLGKAQFEQSPVAPKLHFRVPAEDSGPQIRLKLEINTAEREVYDKPATYEFSVDNPWFSGAATIQTYSNEELLATKLRALLQRNKGRDLIDLSHALTTMKGLDPAKIVALFLKYMEANGQPMSRAVAEQRMLAKLANPNFLADVRPLLAIEEAERFDDAEIHHAFSAVYFGLVERLPGDQWANAEERLEDLGLGRPVAG